MIPPIAEDSEQTNEDASLLFSSSVAPPPHSSLPDLVRRHTAPVVHSASYGNDLPQDTVHNDPALLRGLRGSRLRGSTLVMALYHEQRERKRHQRLQSGTRRSSSDTYGSISTLVPARTSERMSVFLKKVRDGFLADARSLAEATIPQSIVLAFAIGTLCGVVAFLYYSLLEFLLEFMWHTLPEKYVIGVWPEEYYVLWIPLMVLGNALLVGASVVLLGEPGDLAFTISMVHHKAYIPMDHVSPMATASLFSIVGGASLGPEAPLVAICGALGGFVSRKFFGQRTVNVVRKHTLMGMAGALAAFFGAPLGGSLFALEVNSRFGIEYFEHMVEAIFCGEVCLVVFRVLSRAPIAPIWNLTDDILTAADPIDIILGGAIGLCGACLAYIFATFHWRIMALFGHFELLDNSKAILRAIVGAIPVCLLGMLIPATLFWGEMEFFPIATMAPSSELPHVWPTSGLIDFEMDTWWKALLLGFVKMAAISFSVAGGFRGGFIFPFFATGAAFGKVFDMVFPSIPLQVATLCMAAGMNVAITRTSLATTLILTFLSGEPCALPAVLAASLCSLFATSYMTFIKTQIARSDIDHSLYHKKGSTHVVDEFGDPHEIDDEEEE